MFTTLRYDRQTVSLKHASQQTARGFPHPMACTNCRSRKVGYLRLLIAVARAKTTLTRSSNVRGNVKVVTAAEPREL